MLTIRFKNLGPVLQDRKRQTKEDAKELRVFLPKKFDLVSDETLVLAWEKFSEEHYCAGFLVPSEGTVSNFLEVIELVNEASAQKDFLNGFIDGKIAQAQTELEKTRETAIGGRMTILPDQQSSVQHAHGALNALADIRSELIALGIL